MLLLWQCRVRTILPNVRPFSSPQRQTASCRTAWCVMGEGTIREQGQKRAGWGECKRGRPFFLPGPPPTAHFFYSLHPHTYTDTLHIPWQHQVGFHWQPSLLLYLLFLHVRLPILDLVPVTKSYSLVIVSLVLKQKSSRNTILLLGIPDAGKTAIYTRVGSIQDVYGIC